MLLVDKKFVCLTFINNLLLTSLVKHRKTVAFLQNFEICTKFCALRNTILYGFLP